MPTDWILQINQEHGDEKTIRFGALWVFGGQMTVIAAISLLVFLSVGAIATDFGWLWKEKGQIQTAADTAAGAGGSSSQWRQRNSGCLEEIEREWLYCWSL
jgi:hypothetical protein